MICVLPQRADATNMAVRTIADNKFFLAGFNCYHAGAGYDELNVRLHFYIEPTEVVVNVNTKKEERKIVKGWRDAGDVYFANAHITNTNLDALLATRRDNASHLNNNKRKREA